MDTMQIEESIDTPMIHFDPGGNLKIGGRSYPEDTQRFYEPVVGWVTDYCMKPPGQTTVQVKLKYFNSSSYKPLLDILVLLAAAKEKTRLSVEWHYSKGDWDMMEAGEEFAELAGFPFTFHTM